MENQNIIDSTLYVIDKIRPEIEKGNFRGIVRYTEYLYSLCRIVAIAQEREEEAMPIILLPEDWGI